MRQIPGRLLLSTRQIARLGDRKLDKLRSDLEETLSWAADRVAVLEEAGKAECVEKERARTKDLERALERAEREIDARSLDRHQLEHGGHRSQEPT